MAYFAEIDENNIVIRVITWSDDEVGKIGPYSTEIEAHVKSKMGGNWKQTSFSGTAIRKNYAGPGFTWDATNNGFVPPKGDWRDKWTLNTSTCHWEPPHAAPTGADLLTGGTFTDDLGNTQKIKHQVSWVDSANRWESKVYSYEGELQSEHYWNNSSSQWEDK